MENKNIIITIGRQFGCGGREIGHIIANKLNISYFDKELLTQAAHDTGVKTEFFEKADERLPSFFQNLLAFNLGYYGDVSCKNASPISYENIFKAQSDVIRKIAQKSCVIVGRCSDYVLRDNPNCINIFIHSSLEARAKRILERGDAKNINAATLLAEKKNKMREDYYNYYSNKEWGAAKSYDMTLDSSKITSEDCADLVCTFVKMKINHAQSNDF